MIFGENSRPGLAGLNLTHPVWARCWQWLELWNPAKPLGIENFDGDRFYANLHRYATKEKGACKWESHRFTVDLQVVLSGGEFVEYLPPNALQPQGNYDPQKERSLYEAADSTSSLHLSAGRFAVFWPGEPHRPQLSDHQHEGVVKVVFKIHRSLLADLVPVS